jgi:hypothetical protein
MQIEQAIGGVQGDTALQAIQLRMRISGQEVVSKARIRAWDANGANPILIVDMATMSRTAMAATASWSRPRRSRPLSGRRPTS